MMGAEPVKRPREIEEATNAYFIHPISGWLVPHFARLHIPANAVSLIGMACGLGAGLSYYHAGHLPYALLGFALMILWHVMDGADGQLARLTRTQSEIGKVLDGVCDYVTFTAVYVALGIALEPHAGIMIWPLVAAAGASHAVQAAAYEAQRQDYNFWGLQRRSAELKIADPRVSRPAHGPLNQRIADRLIRLYTGMQIAATGIDMRSRQKLAAQLALHPQQDGFVRQSYRQVFAPSIHRWSVLSANTHTMALFLFVSLRLPLYYFYFEIAVLNATLLILLSAQPRRYARLFRLIAAVDEPRAD